MVGLCSVAFGLSAPGQTAGVSVFIDPMIESLNLSRSEISTAYLIGTITSAMMMPRVGRAIDQFGSRASVIAVGVAFGAALAATAGVRGFIGLTIAFFAIRLLGQGSLGLLSTNAVAPWFTRRRGLAIGVTSAVGGSLMSLVPIASAAMIRSIGWRPSWLVLAGIIWLFLVPIGVRGIVDRPSDLGQVPDGVPATDEEHDDQQNQYGVSFRRREALRTPVFWVVGGAVASSAGISTALNFHQIALLGEQGLSQIEAAANFLPQTVGVLLATLAVGALTDHVNHRWILVSAMAGLVGSMAFVPFIAPGLLAILYGLLLGGSTGAVRSLEAALSPQLFGLRELGSIRGVFRFIGVASSAIGPVALATGRDLTGSYAATLTVLIALPAAVAISALIVSNRPPARPTGIS